MIPDPVHLLLLIMKNLLQSEGVSLLLTKGDKD